MAWRQIIRYKQKALSTPSNLIFGFASFSSKSTRFLVKVGIPEFVKGVGGKGVESHVEKLGSEIDDLHKLLVTRTLKFKKLGIPCKQLYPGTRTSFLKHEIQPPSPSPIGLGPIDLQMAK